MNISKSPQKNVGGVASLSYVLVSEVEKFPVIMKYQAINFDDIVLKDGAEWQTIYFSPETCQTDSENKTDDAGSYYNNTIKADYPAENADASIALESIKDIPMLVIAKNVNGVEKLFGTPENPIRLQYNQPTGESVMKTTGYEISISGAGIYPAFFIL